MNSTLQDIGKKYNRIALIGTGGGNDIFSALCVARELIKQGAVVDLFGVLSPGAIHTFNGQNEQAINTLTHHMERFVGAQQKKISFDDTYIPKAIKHLGLDIGTTHELSIKKGNRYLTEAFESFAHTKGYDLLLGVDVGGDILGRIKEDTGVISPMMDHSILHLLGTSHIDSLLLEFGLGTDGEISDINGVIDDIQRMGALLASGKIEKNSSIITDMREIYQFIQDNNLRTGHTIPRTVRTFTEDTSFPSLHHIYQRFGRKTRSTYRPVLLDKKHFRDWYLIDPKALHQQRKTTTSMGHKSLLDHYLHLKNHSQDRKTEMDGLIDTMSNSLMLCISNNFQGKERKEIITRGIHEFESSPLEKAYIYTKDIPDTLMGGKRQTGNHISILSSNSP